MHSIANPIIATLLHSLWQSALLLAFFSIHQFCFPKQSPDSKKTQLVLLVLLQFLISTITLGCYFWDVNAGNNPGSVISFVKNSTYINSFISQHASLLLFIYAAFFSIKFTQTFYHWIGYKKITNLEFLKPDVEIKLFTLRKSLELGIKKNVMIHYANNITSPVTFGYLKPIILMPVALISKLSLEETEALIVHELTHIKNNDFIINWLIILTEQIYFFNPFMSILCKKIRWEREISCDLQVLQFNYNSIVYAGSLYKVAVQNKTTGIFQLNAANNSKELLQRIKYFTSSSEFKFRRTKNNPIFLMSSFALLLFLTFTLSVKNIPIAVKQNVEVVAQKITNSKLVFMPNANSEIKPVIAAAVTKQKQVIKLKKAIPNILHLQRDINQHIPDPNEIKAATVSLQEEKLIEKQIIVKEEDPATGKILTKSYRLINSNGKWITQLLWVIEETATEKNDKANAAAAVPAVQ